MVLGVQMQQRRGTAAQWSASGKILAAGEIGVATDTKIIKIGDGVNEWDDLPVAFEDLYLTIGGTATNSNLLGGISSAGFVKTVEATTAATADTVVKRDASGRSKSAAGVSTDDVVNYDQMVAADLASRRIAVARTVTANFTVEAADVNGVVFVNGSSYSTTIVCTVPTNATVPIAIGSVVEFRTSTSGKSPMSLTPSGGVTVVGTSLIYGHASSMRVLKTGTDSWVVLSANQSPGPYFRRKIKAGSDNTMADGVFTKLRLDGVDSGSAVKTLNFDSLGTGEQWSSSDNFKAFCRRSGLYDIHSQVAFTNAGAGRAMVKLKINNVDEFFGAAVVGDGRLEVAASVHRKVPLDVGDYVEVYGFLEGITATPNDTVYSNSFFEWTWERPL